MVDRTKFQDKIHLQKYLYLINAFLLNKISSSMFMDSFIQVRREDTYWMNSKFSLEVSRIMDSIFLDVDECNPDELYDPNDKFNISEQELKSRLGNKLSALEHLFDQIP